jgi:hypothetical protein
MMNLPIQQIPNQAFSALLDGNQWNIKLKTVNDTTVVTLTLNGTKILESARAVAGGFIIPCVYQEAGNFFFVTQGFELPYYTLFTVTQALVYISPTELAALRIGHPAAKITAASFNPIADLPQRFSPVGYVEA